MSRIPRYLSDVKSVKKAPVQDEIKYLEELTNKRNRLFELFVINPRDTRPALEIKALDDKIWEMRFRKSSR
jgi:hypothetical protein